MQRRAGRPELAVDRPDTVGPRRRWEQDDHPGSSPRARLQPRPYGLPSLRCSPKCLRPLVSSPFVDYSSVLDVSENLGYGESSSNSSNWNSAPEANNALEGEALHWASESKVEPFVGYAGGDDVKFALPCHGQQEHSMAHFDFNLEYF